MLSSKLERKIAFHEVLRLCGAHRQSCGQWHSGRPGVVASFLSVRKVFPWRTLKVLFSLRDDPYYAPAYHCPLGMEVVSCFENFWAGYPESIWAKGHGSPLKALPSPYSLCRFSFISVFLVIVHFQKFQSIFF